MAPINVIVTHHRRTHRLSFPQPSPSSAAPPIHFDQLCEAIVNHLHLPCTAAALADAPTSPLHLWYLQPDDTLKQITDDPSLHYALFQSSSSNTLHLHLEPSSSASSSSHRTMSQSLSQSQTPETENHSRIEANDHDDDEQPSSITPSSSKSKTITRANLPVLLKIFHHLHKHASAPVLDALDILTDIIQSNKDDASALRNGRQQVAKLFSSFLHHLNSMPPDYKVSKPLHRQLVERFDTVAEDIDLSSTIIKASHYAIRSVVNCRFATQLIRTKYTQLVPDDIPPPPPLPDGNGTAANAGTAGSSRSSAAASKIEKQSSRSRRSKKAKAKAKYDHLIPQRSMKHYLRQIDRLVRVASDDVKTFHAKLLRYQKRLEARGFQFPDWPLSACHSIERSVFRISQKCIDITGKQGGKDVFVVKDEAIISLAYGVVRKLKKYGFPDKYVDKAGQFVQMLASDADAVKAVVLWSSKKKVDRIKNSSGKNSRARTRSSNKLPSNSAVPTYVGVGDKDKRQKTKSLKRFMSHLDSSKNPNKDGSFINADIIRTSAFTDSAASRRTNSSSIQSRNSSKSNSARRPHAEVSKKIRHGPPKPLVAGSPKSLDNDDFLFEPFDRNPFMDPPPPPPPPRQTDKKKVTRNGTNIGSSSGSRTVVNNKDFTTAKKTNLASEKDSFLSELNLRDRERDNGRKHTTKIEELEESESESESEFEEDDDDDDDDDDNLDTLNTMELNKFNADFRGTKILDDDFFDDDDDDGFASDGTDKSEWARVTAEKEMETAAREKEKQIHKNGQAAGPNLMVDGRTRHPERADGSPRPPHHDGVPSDNAVSQPNEEGINYNDPRPVNNAPATLGVEGTMADAMRRGGLYNEIGTNIKISKQMQATKDSLAGGSVRAFDHTPFDSESETAPATAHRSKHLDRGGNYEFGQDDDDDDDVGDARTVAYLNSIANGLYASDTDSDTDSHKDGDHEGFSVATTETVHSDQSGMWRQGEARRNEVHRDVAKGAQRYRDQIVRSVSEAFSNDWNSDRNQATTARKFHPHDVDDDDGHDRASGSAGRDDNSRQGESELWMLSHP